MEFSNRRQEDQNRLTTLQKFTRKKRSLRLRFLLFGRAAGGTARPRSATEKPDPLANQKNKAGRDEQDHQKMLDPERHVVREF
jgi:hypothetical protein